ncbi:MAG: DMT family transporter [Anaerostipes sp.]|nr:DMT family transporter [Anaerostipes sp.]
MKTLEKHPAIMIVIGILGISFSAIFVKYSKGPSLLTAGYRLFFTSILLTPVVLGKKKYRKELFQVSIHDILLCAMSGIFLALHFVFWFESLTHTSVASSTAIVCTEVIWVALGYRYFLKGHLSKLAILSITISFLGSILIGASDYHMTGLHLYGDLLALAAAVFVAVYTLIGGVIRKHMTTNVYTYIVYFFCSISLLITILIRNISFLGYGISPIIVGILLSVFSTILGHSIFSWCLKYFSPAFVSASKLCEPFVASFFALFLFQEIPGILQIVGGVITVGGVLLYSYIEIKKET